MTDPQRRPFVLVHGAFHGPWCWERLTPLLTAMGYDVHTPGLSGCEGAEGTDGAAIGLDTHIEDVIGFIEEHDLRDIILLGHSYAGMVITGVADRIADRISRLIYLDAAVPADGQDFASQIPDISPENAAKRRAAFRDLSPDGLWIPPFEPETLGVYDPEDIAWLAARMTPQPLRPWLDPIRLTGAGAHLPCIFILATDPPSPRMGYPLHAEKARRRSGWACLEIASGHDMMVIAPALTAQVLDAAAIAPL